MKQLPASPDLAHLKKQAKHLLRDAGCGNAEAVGRFVKSLPAAGRIDLASYELKLHDAQSVIAREYGFLSWPELKRYVEWKRSDTSERLSQLVRWCIEGNSRELRLAGRMLDEEPGLFDRDPWFACMLGDAVWLAETLARDPEFANRPGGPLAMPPIMAVAHAEPLRDGAADGLLDCARLLIEHGADVNVQWNDPRYPDNPFSALYGAAASGYNPAMTRMLLEAGANPDDNESVYHSVEGDDPACLKLLLDAGARVNGTNALGRVLDFDHIEMLKMMLDHGADPNERNWMHHAILRGRSLDHVRALLDAGGDPALRDADGMSLYAYAAAFGRADVMRLLEERGLAEDLGLEAAFVAACTRADTASARRMLEAQPDMFERLSPRQLRLMPDLAAIGRIDAVGTMLELGWPREVKSAWHATALNLAAFQGDADLVELLLRSGADWRTPHGHGDNVLGAISFCSLAYGIPGPAPLDYVGCARALIEHSVPRSAFDKYAFSDDVTDYLATVG
ncbi:ankyrin repeat domain-containing protein [Rhizobium sp.]